MSQSINLFDARLRRHRELVSAVNIAGAVVVLAVVMIGYGLVLQRWNVQVDGHYQQAAETLRVTREHMGNITKRPVPQPSKALQQELVRVEARLQVRGELLDRLRGGAIGSTEGFSGYLGALARQRADGVWLTGVTIGAGGGEFAVRGRALAADRLPTYIGMLNREQALRGKSIGEMKLVQREQEIPAAPRTGVAAPRAADAGMAADRPKLRIIEFTIGSGAAASGS